MESILIVRSYLLNTKIMAIDTKISRVLVLYIPYFPMCSVDVDTVLRKEPGADCVTPSNPRGLESGHGIPGGEGLDIWTTLEKLKQTQS